MGILSSLYIGVSGLNAQGEALSVFGDNIANASTVGFKVSRPEFHDMVVKPLKPVVGGKQIGRGTALGTVNSVFSQGAIIPTESSTDLSITGDGFFILNGTNGRTYTRNGSFHFDREGKLISADNSHQVVGFQADDKGVITPKLGPISINHPVIDAKKTSQVDLFINLDLRASKDLVFDLANPDKTSNFSTGLTVYDSAGTAHVCTLYFNKEDEGVWSWRGMIKGEEIMGGKKDEMVECAQGKLFYDTDGHLKDQVVQKSSFNFSKGAIPNQSIKFSFGEDKAHGGNGSEVTQYGIQSEAYKIIQDGYTAGTLAGLNFSDDGILTAVYTNGENKSIAQVSLAKFDNPEGLFKNGENQFGESRLSGLPVIGAPQTGGRGKISSKTIEASTTDIANEFINLMQSQRNFQANSKVISTSDEMLQEVLNMKRS